jgi:AraC-like DNA-binding protein
MNSVYYVRNNFTVYICMQVICNYITMSIKLKNISVNFSERTNPNTDDFSIFSFSGNHWDDIFYFPKNYQIGLIQKGQGTFTVGQIEYNLKQGDTYFIKPELVHKGKPDREMGWTVSVINFKRDIIENLIKEGASLSIFNSFQSQKNVSANVEKLILHFQDEITFEEANHLLYEFLEENSDTAIKETKSIKNKEAIERAKKFIEINYKTKFSLDDVANEAFLSKFHLLRLFKQEIGLAPYAYQLQLKLNEARKLIFQKKSLTEVAYELGFNDQAHFIHTYKQHAALTPGDFLKTAIFYNPTKE